MYSYRQPQLPKTGIYNHSPILPIPTHSIYNHQPISIFNNTNPICSSSLFPICPIFLYNQPLYFFSLFNLSIYHKPIPNYPIHSIYPIFYPYKSPSIFSKCSSTTTFSTSIYKCKLPATTTTTTTSNSVSVYVNSISFCCIQKSE